MNPEQAQALLQALQQAVSIVQQVTGDPAADPNAANPEAEMDMAADGAGEDMASDPNAEMESGMDDGMADDMDDDMGFEEGDDDEMTTEMGDEDGMATGNLHDRISQLESHTGLKKSASSGLNLNGRLELLERIHLGTPYEGETVDRVAQLEEKVLGKSAANAAPEVIDFKSLIKAAVEEGRKAGRAEAMAERPAPGQLRSVGKKKAQASLQKSAVDDDDAIDLAELGFGGSLQALYVMNGVARGGGMSVSNYDDGDDD
ncbi:MAG: hypothetical protein ACRC62_19775 [Microcoleus sp.]